MVTPAAEPPSSFEAIPLAHEPIKKRAPRPSSSFPKIAYSPSPSGVETNLLLLLHGAGDSLSPFHTLATRRLQPILPQTATLTVQGQRRIPWLDEDEQAWCYWDVVDEVTGEPIPDGRVQPGDFLKRWSALLDELVDVCGWKAERVHVFGFAHGAQAILEGSVAWMRERRRKWHQQASSSSASAPPKLGSLVSIHGSLLSLPTFTDGPLATPVLFLAPSSGPTAERRLREVRRAFAHVEHVATKGQEVGMPASKEEWDPIMRFWSKVVAQRSRFELDAAEAAAKGEADGQQQVYQVVPSTAPS